MVQPIDVTDHFIQHRGLFSSRKNSKRGGFIWHAVIWTLWTKRNEVIFNNQNVDYQRMFDIIVR